MTYKDLTKASQADYAELDDESKEAPLEYVGNSPTGRVLRFASNRAIKFSAANIDLNAMWAEAHRNDWPMEDLMRFYRGMGYSLCGFLEVFGDYIARKMEPK